MQTLFTRKTLVLLLVLTGCGGAAESGPGAASAGSAPAVTTPGRWEDAASKEQKVAFMKQHVAPRMAKVFQAIDAERYASFDCKVCHGPQFKDPKAFLPKLSMSAGKLTAFADKPEVAKFMAEKVAPEMASALGLPPFDPATHQGFGCGGCHAIENRP